MISNSNFTQEQFSELSTLSQIPRIPRNIGENVTLQNIEEFIEYPLVPIVRELLGKGIRTIESSANMSDISYERVLLCIDFKSLSDLNKRLCLERADAVVSDENFSVSYENSVKQRQKILHGDKRPFIAVYLNGIFRFYDVATFEYPVERDTNIEKIKGGMKQMISFLQNQKE